MGLLAVVCLFLPLQSYGEEHDERRRIVYYFNVVFTFFFLFEAAVKIIVLTPPVSLLPQALLYMHVNVNYLFGLIRMKLS